MDEMKMVSVELDLALWGLEKALEKGDIEQAREHLKWAKKNVEELKKIEAEYLSKIAEGRK